MNFKNWLLQIEISEISAKKYSGAISGSISKWAKDANLVQANLTDIHDANEFNIVLERLVKLQKFIERDTKGKRMYSSALKHFKHYLEDVYRENIKHDVKEILDDSNLNNTEKSQLVNTRLGQGKFRNYQINHWGCCALTGFSDSRFLIASHIKPWKYANNKERLDRYNGLLLLPNLDKVFDLGFITFKPKGNIVISKELESFKRLGLSHDMKLELEESHLEYMSYHRDVVFEKT